MKTSLLLSICFSLLITVTTSCKKSNSTPPKDYAASIKDKSWYGTFAYTGKSTEYYTVAFRADNSLVWSQLSGDTPGQWSLDGNSLTLTFTGNSLQIKGNITDDDKLMTISDNTPNSEILSGQLISGANVYLDNTVWKGSITATAQVLQMSFSSPLKVEISSGTPFGPYTYTSTSSTAGIRFYSSAYGGNVFGVIISDNEMRGNLTLANNLWKLLKQ